MNNERPNPYVGPRSFETGEKLYGRDRELERLTDLLIAERIVLLYSPSGAGKTSLIRAGLAPRLKEEGFTVLGPARVNLVPGEYQPLNRYTFSLLLSLEKQLQPNQQTPLPKLARMTLAEYLFACPKEIPPDEDTPLPQVVIFDQFEEIITINPTDKEGKTQFFAQVAEALYDRRCFALFSMREDFIASLDPYLAPVPSRLNNRFRLDLLEAGPARQAIQGPAKNAGVDFNEKAAEKLINDLRKVTVVGLTAATSEELGQYVEPMQLQVVCYELWKKLDQVDNDITEAEITSIGNVDESLGRYYNSKVGEVAAGSQKLERIIRDWFENDLITESNLRNQVLFDKKLADRLGLGTLENLKSAYLVRGEERRNRVWFEMAHDRLIMPVRQANADWYASNLSVLQSQAALWHKRGQPDSLILRDKDLDEAKGWVDQHPNELSVPEMEFYQECLNRQQREAEIKQAETAAQQEKIRRLEERAQSARRLRVLLVGVALAAVLSIFFAVQAQFSRREAQRQQNFAEENAATATANLARAVYAQETADAERGRAETEKQRAIESQATAELAQATAEAERVRAEAEKQRAIESKATAELAQAEALVEKERAESEKLRAEEALLESNRAIANTYAAEAQLALQVNPLLASVKSLKAYQSAGTFASHDVLLKTLQLARKQSLVPFGEPILNERFSAYSVALSPDGRHLAWGLSNGEIILRDLQQNKNLRPKVIGRVDDLEFSPNGKYLGAVTTMGVKLFNVADGTEVGNFEPGKKPFSISFSPDSSRLAVAVDQVVYLLKVPDLEVDGPPLAGHVFTVQSVDWSPTNNDQLASGSLDGSARVWDLSTREDIRLFRFTNVSPGPGILAVEWTPDGNQLFMVGEYNKAVLFDVAQNKKVGEFSDKRTRFINDLTVSRDGRLLATIKDYRDILIWDIATQSEVVRFRDPHRDNIYSIDFSSTPGTPLLLSGSRDSTIALNQVILAQPIAGPPVSEEGPVGALRQPPETGLLAAVFDQTYAWDQASVLLQSAGEELSQIVYRIDESVSSLAFDASGNFLAYGLNYPNPDTQAVVVEVANGEKKIVNFNNTYSQSARLIGLALNEKDDLLAGSICAFEKVDEENVPTTCASQENYILLRYTDNSAPPVEDTSAHSDYITALAFNPQGDLLVTGSLDETLLFWRIQEGKLVQDGAPLSLRPAGVTALTFNPTGQTLAVGFGDGTLALVDLPSRRVIGEALSGPAVVRSLAFDATGEILYSGDDQGNVIAWDVSPYSWAVKLCEYNRSRLNDAEWASYFPEADYQTPCTDWIRKPE